MSLGPPGGDRTPSGARCSRFQHRGRHNLGCPGSGKPLGERHLFSPPGTWDQDCLERWLATAENIFSLIYQSEPEKS